MRHEKWELLFALAEEQHAAFTAAQSDELGINSHSRARAQAAHLIDRLRPGVWVVLTLIDEWTPMMAIQLQQPRAVAGGRAAAALERFDGVEEIIMDVLVPPNVWLRGSNVHRVSDLVVPEIVVVDGIRCTDEVRTLIDYAALVDDEHVERAMESVFRQDPSKRELLVERATALARHGKVGPARALRVEATLPETRTDSDLETVYWQGLVRYGVPLPQRQYPIGRFFLDHAWADIKLFAELDGYAAHSGREAFIKDRHRQNFVVGQGWSPLRFSDSDVRYYMRRTAMQTRAEVSRRRALLVVSKGV